MILLFLLLGLLGEALSLDPTEDVHPDESADSDVDDAEFRRQQHEVNRLSGKPEHARARKRRNEFLA